MNTEQLLLGTRARWTAHRQTKSEEAQGGREEGEQGQETDCIAGSDWP